MEKEISHSLNELLKERNHKYLTQWLELQLARAKSESIVQILIEGIPQCSNAEPVKKILCQIFSPIRYIMYAATRIYSRCQAGNDSLQEYIQKCTNLVIQTTGIDPTTVICQVTIVLFIWHLYDKELIQSNWRKTVETLRHKIALAQEAEIRLKILKG